MSEPSNGAPLVLSDEQETVVREILAWAGGPGAEYSLGGFAGTGKTTLVGRLVSELARLGGVAVCAPTGKAAHVLKTKGLPGATTIHAMIYDFQSEVPDPTTGELRPIFSASQSSRSDAMFVVVDESSMVNETMANDLRPHRHRLLWVGDHGQLPPVGGDPGIMANPKSRLETIHRQAEGSTILRLAHRIRTGDDPRALIGARYDDCVVSRAPGFSRMVDDAVDMNIDFILCAFNNTRHQLNALFRARLGLAGVLEGNDRVICLRNDHTRQLYNGMVFSVTAVRPHEAHPGVIVADILTDTGEERCGIPMQASQFGAQRTEEHETEAEAIKEVIGEKPMLFDYAFAITAHKAQGSEADRVGVFYQRFTRWSMPRWGYTAVTRAKQYLHIWA